MTIEVSLLLSGISVAFAIYLGMSRQSRETKKDVEESTKTETATMTTVVNKLATIELGIIDIKSEINCIKRDFKEDHDRIIRLEALKDFKNFKPPITADLNT